MHSSLWLLLSVHASFGRRLSRILIVPSSSSVNYLERASKCLRAKPALSEWVDDWTTESPSILRWVAYGKRTTFTLRLFEVWLPILHWVLKSTVIYKRQAEGDEKTGNQNDAVDASLQGHLDQPPWKSLSQIGPYLSKQRLTQLHLATLFNCSLHETWHWLIKRSGYKLNNAWLNHKCHPTFRRASTQPFNSFPDPSPLSV